MTPDGTDEPGHAPDEPGHGPDGASIGRVAHDLNNALAAIGAFGYLIRTDPALPDGIRHQAGLLVVETERARTLAAQLVDAVGAAEPGSTIEARGPAPQIGPRPAAGDGRPARVLVVDDEASIRDFLGRVLQRAGQVPLLAASGSEALEIVRARPPDAILCDHRMSGMSGTEFHAAVLRIVPDLDGRFAFMSGDVLDPELRAVAADGDIPILAKPFDIATIGAMLDRLLAGATGPAAGVRDGTAAVSDQPGG